MVMLLPAESQILVARKDELKQLRRAIPYKVGMQTMLFAAPVLAAVASFAAYGAADPTAFTPARIFTAISLFSLMRMPLIFLPFALVQVRLSVWACQAFVFLRLHSVTQLSAVLCALLSTVSWSCLQSPLQCLACSLAAVRAWQLVTPLSAADAA